MGRHRRRIVNCHLLVHHGLVQVRHREDLPAKGVGPANFLADRLKMDSRIFNR